MKFLAIASLAASAAAAPALQTRQSNGTISDNTPFNLVAIRSGSSLQYAPFSAARDGLHLLQETQGASCQQSTNSATFYLANGGLYLYTPSNVTQELYTDRSGMGQGVLQYSTTPGGYLPSRNAETTGWTLDAANDLTFKGAGLLACPAAANSTAGPYSVWVDTDVANPGGNSGCVGVSARAVPATEKNACVFTYSSSSS